VQLGLLKGGNTPQYRAANSNLLYLPPTASRLDMLIDVLSTTGTSHIGKYKVQLLTSGWRVKTKTIKNDQGQSYPYTYGYQGAALNTELNTDNICPAISDPYNPPTTRDCLAITPIYTEFRGHSQVTETAPRNASRENVTLVVSLHWMVCLPIGI
jgi:hypothetical protein